MKTFLLTVGSSILVFIATALSFISAEQYGLIFAVILIFDCVALWMISKLFQKGKVLIFYAVILIVFDLYSICDVMGRMIWGIRPLDFFVMLRA